MGQDFDPYLQWLGISKNEPRPVHFYRLLGIDLFESDPDVIAMNGDKQIEHLRKFSTGQHGDLAEQLINTLVKAKLTLLKPDRKADYDAQLRAARQPVAQATLPPSATAYAPPVPAAAAVPLYAPAAPVMGYSTQNAPAQNYPAQSYPAQSYPAQNYPAQSYPGQSYPAQSYPVPWDPEATIPIAPSATTLPPAHMHPTVSAAPTAGENYMPDVGPAVRSFAIKAGPVSKPRRSSVTWGILAVSVAACVGLTMILAGRYSDKDPIAEKDPAATKKNPTETTPDAPPNNTPSGVPSHNKQTPPDAAVPENKGPRPEQIPPQPIPVRANKPKFAWPPIADPREVQVVVQDPQNPAMTLYRYPGTNPRMATIITRGHTASRWNIENWELILRASNSGEEFLLFGDPNWTDYTVEFEAYKDYQTDVASVGILFRCEDDSQLQLFHNGYRTSSVFETWSPDQKMFRILNDINGLPAPEGSGRLLPSRVWRKESIEVIGRRVHAKRGIVPVLSREIMIPAKGRVGLRFQTPADTTVRVRNIRVTAPDGTQLWEGLPELPPSLAATATKPVPQEVASAERTTRFPGPRDDATNKNPIMTNLPTVNNNIPRDVPSPNPLNNPNPDPSAPNSTLSALAEKDEEIQKFIAELDAAREVFETKIKKFEDDYLKAFDNEMTRVRNTTTLSAVERADLLIVLAQDKKDFETKKRFSISHGMLPQNKVIGLMLIERQRYERVYEQMIDRMLKEKRDDVVPALKSALLNDRNLRPLRVFSVKYHHTPLSSPVRYDFMADRTINGQPKVFWNIDADKRLNISGPLQGSQETVEQLKLTMDGRKLVEGKSKTSSTVKTGSIIVD